MDGYERRKDKKIMQIFSASHELVMKHGFDKVRVDEIAKKARVSPATIYNYFGTKEQLYQQMLNNWIDSRLKDYERIINSEIPFNEKIREIITLEAKNINLLTNLNQDQSGSVLFFLNNIEEKFESFFLKLIQLGKSDGYIAHHYSEQILKRYFKLFFQEISDYINTKNNNSEVLEQLLQLFFYGLSSLPNR
ncbi:TetR family transcriptional regulator [Ornithinibacillus sp. L9]|uniref:TetR family transcriptional regulator n=1 Tax=Ornithinibacillus caprae TaxID=2678566 RepID=A0A6N8FJM0_9BACI|nr:TetR/AcrR family transcriptional regulator [Ornithinibacillus caprae]MUK88504.1 TetR family transcriptional regulator [Ornithinibacillus caprae]